MATAFGENAPKYDVQCKSSNLKIFSKISAEMLVKDISIFCAIYPLLAPLHIAQIGWSNDTKSFSRTCPTNIGLGWKG